jgi:hypothetical protein
LLLSVSKHNMWSYYDNNDNPIITQPHIVFTDGRQQRQPNHNTTTYCVYWRRQRQPNHNTTTYYVYWRTTTSCRPSVNTICGRIIIGLSLLSSVSKHNMWSYYDWVYCCCRPSVNTICRRIMIYCMFTDRGQQRKPIIIRPHIVFTDGRQRQPNYNTTIYLRKHNMWSYYDWVVVVFLQ